MWTERDRAQLAERGRTASRGADRVRGARIDMGRASDQPLKVLSGGDARTKAVHLQAPDRAPVPLSIVTNSASDNRA